MLVLLMEKEEAHGRFLANTLKKGGFKVHAVRDTREMRENMATFDYELILVNLDQFDEIIRHKGVYGYSDYLVTRVGALYYCADAQPRDCPEIVERLWSILVRLHGKCGPVLSFGDVDINIPLRKVRNRGAEVHLQPLEMKLLITLALKSPGYVKEEEMRDQIYGCEREPVSNTLNSRLSRMKGKLDGINIISQHYKGWTLR